MYRCCKQNNKLGYLKSLALPSKLRQQFRYDVALWGIWGLLGGHSFLKAVPGFKKKKLVVVGLIYLEGKCPAHVTLSPSVTLHDHGKHYSLIYVVSKLDWAWSSLQKPSQQNAPNQFKLKYEMKPILYLMDFLPILKPRKWGNRGKLTSSSQSQRWLDINSRQRVIFPLSNSFLWVLKMYSLQVLCYKSYFFPEEIFKFQVLLEWCLREIGWWLVTSLSSWGEKVLKGWRKDTEAHCCVWGQLSFLGSFPLATVSMLRELGFRRANPTSTRADSGKTELLAGHTCVRANSGSDLQWTTCASPSLLLVVPSGCLRTVEQVMPTQRSSCRRPRAGER